MLLSNFIKGFFPECDLNNKHVIRFYKRAKTPFYDKLEDVLIWPPNVFLILISIIDYTDKYRLMVSPQAHFCWGKDKKRISDKIKNDWLSYFRFQNNQPGAFRSQQLKKLLMTVFNPVNFDRNIYDLMNQSDFCEAVFILLVSIDKVFSKNEFGRFDIALQSVLLAREIKIASRQKKDPSSVKVDKNNLADNAPMNGMIAQKFNTPQSGLTINNVTQNLTFIKPSVKFSPVSRGNAAEEYASQGYNILIIPWPFEVKDDYFRPAKFIDDNYDMDKYFDFFDYSPAEKFSLVHFLSFILSALKRVGSINLIVFPECSLSRRQFESLSSVLYEIFKTGAPSLLSGIFGKNGDVSENYALLAFISESRGGFDFIQQNKHHRWFLDKNQLRNYNLSLALDPNKKWWENISVDRRNLTILKTSNGVTLCPLVCEDLARQEPVAQAVRAIGPNLVISLLLDGPQISPRWPGKYAAVLADDPGSSVLSVTALGMTRRSTGLGHPPSNEIALWSEPGKTSESLKVTSDTGALVLELSLEHTQMWSLDGRSERKPLLRKVVHTEIGLDFSNQSVLALKQSIFKAIGNRR